MVLKKFIVVPFCHRARVRRPCCSRVPVGRVRDRSKAGKKASASSQPLNPRAPPADSRPDRGTCAPAPQDAMNRLIEKKQHDRADPARRAP